VRRHARLIARLALAAGVATLLAACSTVAPPGPRTADVDTEAVVPVDAPRGAAAELPAERTPSASAEPSENPRAAAPGQRAVDEALAQLGVPYRFGGSGPQGFDCSGLVQHAYRRAGITLPRDTREQRLRTRPLSEGGRDLRPGDLLFFHRDRRGALHVALYIGDRRFVHAPSSGKAVRVESLDDPHWRRRFIEARRPS
jgi:cell wall-associated NlpC family hydrolase